MGVRLWAQRITDINSEVGAAASEGEGLGPRFLGSFLGMCLVFRADRSDRSRGLFAVL